MGHADITELVVGSASDRANRRATSMHWLLRYARHHIIDLNHDCLSEQALKRRFSAAAWRLICRSGRSAFLPILRHRDLCFDDLVFYAERLVDHGWRQAPVAEHLAFFIDQCRYSFDRPAHVPTQDVDYHLLCVCQREDSIALSDLALVNNWVDQTSFALERYHRWSRLLDRARKWKEATEVQARHALSPPWHFYTRSLNWRGYEIVPLNTPLDLWDEGQAMRNCLYKLKHLCKRDTGSRYFSVRKDGRRVATLELEHLAPQAYFHGMDRVRGKWAVLDCRQALNRMPKPIYFKNCKPLPGSTTFGLSVQVGLLPRFRPLSVNPAPLIPTVRSGGLHEGRELSIFCSQACLAGSIDRPHCGLRVQVRICADLGRCAGCS